MIAQTHNDVFELPDGFFILKKHEKLTPIPSIHVYINKINNRLVFKI